MSAGNLSIFTRTVGHIQQQRCFLKQKWHAACQVEDQFNIFVIKFMPRPGGRFRNTAERASSSESGPK